MPKGKQPPTYPTDLDEINEAVQLCGKFSRGGVNRVIKQGAGQARLAKLCGRLPASRDEAQSWKIWLRALWREAQAEPPELSD